MSCILSLENIAFWLLMGIEIQEKRKKLREDLKIVKKAQKNVKYKNKFTSEFLPSASFLNVDVK